MKRNVIPAVLAPILVASSIFFSGQTGAAADLADKSAAEILAMINTDPKIALSGQIIKKADLGLPPMNLVPDISQSMVDSMRERLPAEMADFIPEASIEGELALILEFFAGTHKANIYMDGPRKVRLQVLDLLSERNFIRNGEELWFYDAAKSRAIRGEIDLVEEEAAQNQMIDWFNKNSAEFAFDITSPISVAQYFLDQAGPSTTFTVEEDLNIAGRDAYQISLLPKTSGSLVEKVNFAIDAENGIPLSVSVKAVNQESLAFEIAFQTISFQRPDGKNFDFQPPAGTQVVEAPSLKSPSPEELPAELKELKSLAQKKWGDAPSLPADFQAQVEAELEKAKEAGWAAVAQLPAELAPNEFAAELQQNRLYKELTRKVAGGRVFSTALFNIYFADSGAIFAGAVTVEKLLEVARQ
jgi:outer membrane lipoprotein-sorting protein